jgi:hypothetical protein
MSEPSDAIERLAQRIEELERRVDALEHPLAAPWPRLAHKPGETPTPASIEAAGAAQAGGIFAVLGKAMLGIAGAYLLRALEETGTLPRLLVACAGIVYAFLWMAWAARSPRQLNNAIYACTSAAILAPMLWELTLRFQSVSAAFAAGVLCAYALVAYALTRKRNLAPVFRVCVIAAAGLSLALAIASHAALPFTAALLAMAALGEFVPERDRMIEIRAPVALAADAAIWNLIYANFSPHAGFPELGRTSLLAPAIALFLIFAAGVSLQTIVRGARIAVFETLQSTIAFLLFAVSWADFGPASATIVLGILCLTLAATCYAAVFAVFAGQSEPRNFAVFAAWGAALLLWGCLLSLSPAWTAACLGGAAIAATFVGRRKSWVSFEFYGALFLFTAAAESGLFSFLANALVSRPSGAPSLIAGLIGVAAILCYAIAGLGPEESWRLQALHLAVAALALGAVLAMAIEALVALTALMVAPGAHHLALIRTLTLCSAAVALVFGGARWRRAELTRLGYATLALVAVKLVAEDLRHGHLAYIAASIFLFALALIAAPRVARARQRA